MSTNKMNKKIKFALILKNNEEVRTMSDLRMTRRTKLLRRLLQTEKFLNGMLKLFLLLSTTQKKFQKTAGI